MIEAEARKRAYKLMALLLKDGDISDEEPEVKSIVYKTIESFISAAQAMEESGVK